MAVSTGIVGVVDRENKNGLPVLETGDFPSSSTSFGFSVGDGAGGRIWSRTGEAEVDDGILVVVQA